MAFSIILYTCIVSLLLAAGWSNNPFERNSITCMGFATAAAPLVTTKSGTSWPFQTDADGVCFLVQDDHVCFFKPFQTDDADGVCFVQDDHVCFLIADDHVSFFTHCQDMEESKKKHDKDGTMTSEWEGQKEGTPAPRTFWAQPGGTFFTFFSYVVPKPIVSFVLTVGDLWKLIVFVYYSSPLTILTSKITDGLMVHWSALTVTIFKICGYVVLPIASWTLVKNMPIFRSLYGKYRAILQEPSWPILYGIMTILMVDLIRTTAIRMYPLLIFIRKMVLVTITEFPLDTCWECLTMFLLGIFILFGTAVVLVLVKICGEEVLMYCEQDYKCIFRTFFSLFKTPKASIIVIVNKAIFGFFNHVRNPPFMYKPPDDPPDLPSSAACYSSTALIVSTADQDSFVTVVSNLPAYGAYPHPLLQLMCQDHQLLQSLLWPWEQHNALAALLPRNVSVHSYRKNFSSRTLHFGAPTLFQGNGNQLVLYRAMPNNFQENTPNDTNNTTNG